MATTDDLRSFLENRLLALDPSMDLSPGSPAQVNVIDPIIARLSEDPFSVDIPTFLKDRMTQEYPELVADGGGVLVDTLLKPLQLILEPFKREIELVRLGQSVTNASLMGDDEADALGANWFLARNEGSFSGGTVRIYFNAPTTTRITPDKRVFSKSGLSFFPTESFFITSAQMLFNRQGALYFVDITVRAEQQGDEYNVDKDEIIGIEDVAGVVKTTNLAAFTSGAPRQTNEDYLGSFDTVLTERSLVTRRGITTRVPSLFESVRALAVVGAGEQGMNRDILTGTGEGFLHMAGKATSYGEWLFVSEITYRDDGPDNSVVPAVNDTIRYHIAPPGSVTGTTQVFEATIVDIRPSTDGLYLFLLDQNLSVVSQGRFALLKAGFITISGVPGGITSSANVVPDGTIHLGGHTDVFVRPTSDSTIQTTLEDVTDGAPILAMRDVIIPTAGQNIIQSAQLGASEKRPEVGDLVVIETGVGFAGTYRILEIDSPSVNSVRVDSKFASATAPGVTLRARLVRNIRVNLVEPRVPKLPFDTGTLSDLNTNVNSATLILDTTDIISFGAVIGDTFRILDGEDAGDYKITGFDPVLGGRGPIVDKAPNTSAANLRYEVFTALSGLTFPLVRLKGLEVLDATQQATGITVPYGDAVDIRPTANLEGAGLEQTTLDRKLFILPDLRDIWSSGDSPTLPDQRPSTVAAQTDARYTQKLEIADGVVRRVIASAGNDIQTIEINLPPFMWNGRRDKLMAFTTKKDNDFVATGTHFTSDIADALIGDTITIADGPNRGSYIIKDKRILDLWGRTSVGHQKVAIIQVDPELPSDPMRTALNLIGQVGTPIGAVPLVGLFEWSTDFDNPAGFYLSFLNTLLNRLATLNVNFASVDDLKVFFDPLVKCGYSVGPAARGDFRLYFQDPVSVEFNFRTDPTMFQSLIDPSKKFRISLDLPDAQILPESETPTPPTQWNRDADVDTGNPLIINEVGGSFPLKGIRAKDLLEYYPAVNDLPARPNMASSWVCCTQEGTNLVQLLLPPQAELDNFEPLVAGQILFIDSGPDAGAYTIVSVDSQLPTAKVRVDQTLTHSTLDAPGSVSADFASATFPWMRTIGNAFPMVMLGDGSEILSFQVSVNGGATFTTQTYTVPPSTTYNTVNDLVTALSAVFTNFSVVADSNEIVVRALNKGTSVILRLGSATTAHALLKFKFNGTPGVTTRTGKRGGAALQGGKRVYSSVFDVAGLAAATDPQYISLYVANHPTILNVGGQADDTAYLGTFLITGEGTETSGVYTGEKYVDLERSANFPALAAADVDPATVRWIIHSKPTVAATETSGGGKSLSDQYVRFRMYDSVPRRLTVANIPWSASPHPLDTNAPAQLTLSDRWVPSLKNFGYKNPYRFIRPGIFRLSSTSMSKTREGALYYVDLPVLGLGPREEMNVKTSEGFFLIGNFSIEGYTLEVKDENFTFSTKEDVDLILPKSVLPVGSTPELENEFPLAGSNIQVTYDIAPLVDDLQRFFDSPQDRVLVANTLVRHFLPSYVSLDAEYVGGSSTDIVAKDIINYINTIDPSRNILQVNKIVDLIRRKNATDVTLPIFVVSLTHGIDRKIRGMRSENAIGGSELAFFKGNFSQNYFISGPDTSTESVRPDGEQIFLKRT